MVCEGQKVPQGPKSRKKSKQRKSNEKVTLRFDPKVIKK